MGETRELAEYLADLSFESLPEGVIHKTKRLILDYLGYAVAAVGERRAEILLELVNALGGVEEATILGVRNKTTCLNASLINGTMGHILEMDDTHRFTMSHPGDSIIPASLAVAEKVGAQGKKFLEAVIAGYEAALRIGAAISPSHYAKGWHTTGSICTFGAATGPGKILNFNADQIENALGLAGVQAAGMFGPGGVKSSLTYMTKDFRPGKAAMNGVLSALLTSMGFTGNPGILEGDKGFCALYSDEYNLRKVTEKLGTEYKIMEVGHKAYSACRYIHSAIDATLELIQRHNISKNNIKRIIVEGYENIAVGMDDPEPKGSFAHKYSMQFQIALTIAEGESGLKRIMGNNGYTLEKTQNSEIRGLMKKVEMIHNKEMDKEWPDTWATKVTIEKTEGDAYSHRVDYPKGEPESDLTEAELNEKFRILASKVLDESKVNGILETVCRLDKLKDINGLTILLTP